MAWFHAFLMLFISFIIVLQWLPAEEAAATTNKPAAGCQNKCGNVDIPYPFGIGTDEGCSIDNKHFYITCNDTFNPPKPFLTDGNIPVSNISVLHGQIVVMLYIANDCSDKVIGDTQAWITKFTFSDTRNKFIAIGCDTKAFLEGSKSGSYSIGCMSQCESIDDVINGSCTGIGCCQTSIPKGLKRYNVRVDSINETRNQLIFNPCSYAFLAEENWFNFSSTDLKDFNPNGEEKAPVVLEWTIGDKTCDEAKNNSASYGCGPNTDCYEPNNSPGYRCKCKNGYEGNPYLTSNGSCQDVDECRRNNNICKGLSNICDNTVGHYNCSCPEHFTPQRRNFGILDCIKPDQPKKDLLNKVLMGTGIGCGVLIIVLLLLLLLSKMGLLVKNNLRDERDYDHLIVVELQGRCFNFREIKAATGNFNPKNMLGEGGFGPVYKGVLPNNILIAVKQLSAKSKQGAREFINEVETVSTLKHENLVKLLGCCTENNQLLLVYEYMENNSLSNALFGPSPTSLKSRLNWRTRFNICLGIAEGLLFLHEKSKVKIIHRDIKPANVLLDKDLKAKISDFGLAKPWEGEKTHISTKALGTIGYMAPEYAMHGWLTNKADVYSFGVVTLELMSGKNNTSSMPNDETIFLLDKAYVLQQKGNLLDLIDPVLKMDCQKKEAAMVLDLAMLCTAPSPSLRPIMSEVVSILKGDTKITKSLPVHRPYSIDDFRKANDGVALQYSSTDSGKTDEPSTSKVDDKLDTLAARTPHHDEIVDEDAYLLKNKVQS